MKWVIGVVLVVLVIAGCAEGGMLDQVQEVQEIQKKLQETEAQLAEAQSQLQVQEQVEEQPGADHEPQEDKGIIEQVLEEQEAQEQSEETEQGNVSELSEEAQAVLRKAQEEEALAEQEREARRQKHIVEVFANRPWEDTGIIVPTGVRFTVTVVGGEWSHGPSELYGGRGSAETHYAAIEPYDPLGALLVRVGGRWPVLIGDRRTVTNSEVGELQFAMNDFEDPDFKYHEDNKGVLLVEVEFIGTGEEPATNTPVPTSTPESTNTPVPTSTPRPTPTPRPSPTPTSKATSAPILTPDRSTPNPDVAYVTAVTAVNVRSGPSTTYEKVGILYEEQSTVVTGVSQDGVWWVINFPPAAGNQGWVSGEFMLAQNTDNVPVVESPPVPEPTAPPPVSITDWMGEYFNNREVSGAPVLVRNDPKIDFAWGAGSPAPEVPADNFSARWTIRRNMPAGTYRFSVWGDDGIRVFMDNVKVLDQWQEGPVRNSVADIKVDAGDHEVRVEYFEATGGALVQLNVGYLTR